MRKKSARYDPPGSDDVLVDLETEAAQKVLALAREFVTKRTKKRNGK